MVKDALRLFSMERTGESDNMVKRFFTLILEEVNCRMTLLKKLKKYLNLGKQF